MPISCLFINRSLIPIQLGLILLCTCSVVKGQESTDILWLNIETKHTIIRYQSERDLKKFNSKIKYRVERWSLEGLFSSSGSSDLEDTLSNKVDALFERVQQILDMRKKIKKLTIHIYHDKEQLQKAYESIYEGPCRVRAWYEYKFNTVYLNVNDTHENMLAHEMAHSIIDHYLLVRPPIATAEILARYVDSHLKNDDFSIFQ